MLEWVLKNIAKWIAGEVINYLVERDNLQELDQVGDSLIVELDRAESEAERGAILDKIADLHRTRRTNKLPANTTPKGDDWPDQLKG